MIKKILLPLAFCIMLTLAAFANEARDITAEVGITAENIKISALTDNKIKTSSVGENIKITLECAEKMGGVWVRYSAEPQGARLDGVPLEENGFWSRYVDLGSKTGAVLEYESAAICDLKVYSEGELPAEVQLWERSEGESDVMLFASHSDDDQLFFAGFVPYYVAQGANVKVCFFTTSYQDISRVQELLAGLWHCGLKNYPVIFPLPDDYSESYDGALSKLERQGYTLDTVKGMVREVLDTYEPSVIVLHDFKGEYSHGMHIFATKVITDTVAESTDGDFVPKKVYVHLYKENGLVLPIDEPLEFFGGKSAFNVSQEAFQNHKSQHWTWFYDWIYGKSGEITKASQIRYYNPANYGLYYTSVGNDTGSDMLENVETVKEKAARLERERLEEEARIAEEQRAAEESRLKEESVAAEESRLKEEAAKNEKAFPLGALLPMLAAVIIAIFAVAYVLIKKRKV